MVEEEEEEEEEDCVEAEEEAGANVFIGADMME